MSTDSRKVTPGALFVALAGERFDGHDFVAAAIAAGAAGAMVSRLTPEMAAAPCLLQVEDTLAGLGAMAAAHRRRFDLDVIGITGSTGKTTTKEMTANILERERTVLKTPASYNNEVGVPLTALELNRGHQAAVFELAMRGRGQIRYLAEMIRPTVAIITNIGRSHLELLNTREAIAETKAELLEALPAGGVAVLNADDPYCEFLRDRARGPVITFGLSAGAAVRAERVRTRDEPGVEFTLVGWDFRTPVRLRLPGRHNALDAAAAAAAARALGVSPEAIRDGLMLLSAGADRMQVLQAPGGFAVISDCYNAAPDSMRMALEVLAEMPARRRMAVLGDMRELGPMEVSWHREVGELAAAMDLALLVTRGELGSVVAEGAASQLSGRVRPAKTNEEAAELIREVARPGDVVLVKGSRAMHLEEVVRRLIDG